MPGPRWLSDDEQAAWRGLLRMSGALAAELNRELAASAGLSLQDYAVLVLLSEAPGGELRPYEIGRQLAIEKTRLSHHLARLVERGLVTRDRCPTDQRGWLITMTPAGRRAIEAAAPDHVAAVRRVFIERLTAQQLRQLVAIADAVLAGPMCAESAEDARGATSGDGRSHGDDDGGRRQRQHP